MKKQQLHIRDEDMLTAKEQILIGGTPDSMIPWAKSQWSIPFGMLSNLKNGTISKVLTEKIQEARSERRYLQSFIYDGSRARDDLNLQPGEVALVKLPDIDLITGVTLGDPSIVAGKEWDPDEGKFKIERDITDEALVFLRTSRAELGLREGKIQGGEGLDGDPGRRL